MTLTSVTDRRAYHEDTFADWDFASATLTHTKIDRKYKKIFQELRLDYAKDRLKWLVGAYYDEDENGVGYTNESDFPSMDMITSRDLEENENAYAVFSSVTYPLTDRLGVVAGLRHEHQDSEFVDHLDGRNFDDSWETLSPKAGLEPGEIGLQVVFRL